MNEPQDGFSELKASSISMHEWYHSMLEAGFTPQEALYLVAQVIIGAGKKDS